MNETISILLVEDNPGDADLTKETLEGGKLAVDVQVMRDGTEALRYLHGEPPYARAVQPDLILLDLNLPKLDGKEVLAEIRRDERLRHIPVVILSSSDSPNDVASSYRAGANCYVTKPIGLTAFQALVREVEAFWFELAELPGPQTEL